MHLPLFIQLKAYHFLGMLYIYNGIYARAVDNRLKLETAYMT